MMRLKKAFGLLETNKYDVVPAGAALVQTYRTAGTGVFVSKSQGQPDKSDNITWKLTSSDQTLEINNGGVVSYSTVTELTERRLQGCVTNANPRFVFLLLK